MRADSQRTKLNFRRIDRPQTPLKMKDMRSRLSASNLLTHKVIKNTKTKIEITKKKRAEMQKSISQNRKRARRQSNRTTKKHHLKKLPEKGRHREKSARNEKFKRESWWFFEIEAARSSLSKSGLRQLTPVSSGANQIRIGPIHIWWHDFDQIEIVSISRQSKVSFNLYKWNNMSLYCLVHNFLNDPNIGLYLQCLQHKKSLVSGKIFIHFKIL